MLALSEGVVSWVLPLIALLAVLGVLSSSVSAVSNTQRRVAVGVLILTLLCSVRVLHALNRPLLIPSFVQTTGTVVEVRPWGRLYAAAVKTPQGGYVLKIPFATLAEGDRIALEGTPKPFKGLSEKSDFREDRFWRSRGMTAQLTSPRTRPLAEQGWNIHRWRYRLYRSLTIHMPRLTGDYLKAAWTGKRDEGLNAAHKSWGSAHLLAISGFHVGIVMLAASLVFKRGKMRVLCLTFILWGYIFLTGAPASAVRAGLMIQVALFGELAGRPGSPINSVSLAAVALLSLSPFWFWDIGWRLSVLAALVIAAVLERSAPNDWKVWLSVSPLIWLATFPQVSWTFGAVPLVGIFINFVAPPFFSFALSFASFAAMLRFMGLPGAGLLLYALEGGFILWGIAADALAALIPWQLTWGPYLAYCCVGMFVALLCRSLFVPWRNVAILAPLGSLSAFFLFG